MTDLQVSFSIVAPLLIMMAAGLLIRRTGLVSEDGFRSANRIVLYVGFPTLIFKNLVTSDLSSVADPKFTIFLIVSLLVCFAALMLLVPLFVKDPRRRGVLIQGLYRTNDAAYGLAVGAALLGEDSLALISYAVALAVPVYNVLGTFALELYSSGRPRVGRLLLDVFKNPIVDSVLLGVLVKLLLTWTGWSIPAFLMEPVSKFAAMCGPLAFLVLGGLISFSSMRKNRLVLTVSTLVRLVLIPCVFVVPAYLFGFRGEQLVAILLIFGAPTSMSSFPIACGFDCDSELAGELVAVTTAFSLISMFIYVYFFSRGGVL